MDFSRPWGFNVQRPLASSISPHADADWADHHGFVHRAPRPLLQQVAFDEKAERDAAAAQAEREAGANAAEPKLSRKVHRQFGSFLPKSLPDRNSNAGGEISPTATPPLEEAVAPRRSRAVRSARRSKPSRPTSPRTAASSASATPLSPNSQTPVAPAAYVRALSTVTVHALRTRQALLPPAVAPHPLSRDAQDPYALMPHPHSARHHHTSDPPPLSVASSLGTSVAMSRVLSILNSQRGTSDGVDGDGAERSDAHHVGPSLVHQAPLPVKKLGAQTATKTQLLQHELFALVAPLQNATLSAQATSQMRKIAKALKSSHSTSVRVFPDSLRTLARQKPVDSFESGTGPLLELLAPHIALPHLVERERQLEERKLKPWRSAQAFDPTRNTITDARREADRVAAELALTMDAVAPADVGSRPIALPTAISDAGGGASVSLSMFRAPPAVKWVHKGSTVVPRDSHRIPYQSAATSSARTSRVERPHTQLRTVDPSEVEEASYPELESKVQEHEQRMHALGEEAKANDESFSAPRHTTLKRIFNRNFLVDHVKPGALLKAGLKGVHEVRPPEYYAYPTSLSQLAGAPAPIASPSELPFPTRSGSRSVSPSRPTLPLTVDEAQSQPGGSRDRVDRAGEPAKALSFLNRSDVRSREVSPPRALAVDHFPTSPQTRSKPHSPSRLPAKASPGDGFLTSLLSEVMPEVYAWQHQQRKDEKSRRKRAAREAEQARIKKDEQLEQAAAEHVDSVSELVEAIVEESTEMPSDPNLSPTADDLESFVNRTHSEPASEVLTIEHPEEGDSTEDAARTTTMRTASAFEVEIGSPSNENDNLAAAFGPTAILTQPTQRSGRTSRTSSVPSSRRNSLHIALNSRRSSNRLPLGEPPAPKPFTPGPAPTPASTTTSRTAASVNAISRRRTATAELKQTFLALDFSKLSASPVTPDFDAPEKPPVQLVIDLAIEREKMKRKLANQQRQQAMAKEKILTGSKEDASVEPQLDWPGDEQPAPSPVHRAQPSIGRISASPSSQRLAHSSSRGVISNSSSTSSLSMPIVRHSGTHSLVTPETRSKLISLLTRVDGVPALHELLTGSQSARVYSPAVNEEKSDGSASQRTIAPVTAAAGLMRSRPLRQYTHDIEHQAQPLRRAAEATTADPDVVILADNSRFTRTRVRPVAAPLASGVFSLSPPPAPMSARLSSSLAIAPPTSFAAASADRSRSLTVIRHLQTEIAKAAQTTDQAAPFQMRQRRLIKVQQRLQAELEATTLAALARATQQPQSQQARTSEQL